MHDAGGNLTRLLDCVSRAHAHARATGALEGTVQPLMREAVRYGHHLARELGLAPRDLDPRLVDPDFCGGGE